MSGSGGPAAAPDLQGVAADDIRHRLRADHEATLADAERLRAEKDSQRALHRLRELRRAWVIHALAEETVVYRALEAAEGVPFAGTRSDERFVEHELVESLFAKLARLRPGSHEWAARLNVARDLIARHIESEHDEMFTRLARNFGADGLAELGRRFGLARDKLALLEEAKAA
ncbi:MAG TPA: hemerythrin domain-containing protein [Usitatibacter sp.]|nr:hemerythrin domain-containing protein [Usitatibacter sp.]